MPSDLFSSVAKRKSSALVRLDLSNDSHSGGVYSPGAYPDRSDTRQSDFLDLNRYLSS